jgi:hypothetical protein
MVEPRDAQLDSCVIPSIPQWDVGLVVPINIPLTAAAKSFLELID